MFIKYSPNDVPKIQCDNCGDIEIGFIYRENDAIRCIYCLSQVGYIWDLDGQLEWLKGKL